MTKTLSVAFGTDIRIEQHGREVHVVISLKSEEDASAMLKHMVGELAAGTLKLTLTPASRVVTSTAAPPVTPPGEPPVTH